MSANINADSKGFSKLFKQRFKIEVETFGFKGALFLASGTEVQIANN